MKKKLLVVGAVALAGALVMATGCSTKTRNLASLSSNWYYDQDFKRIQPTFTEENAEILTYKVTYSEPSDVHNAYYSVNFEEGTYTTKFYAKKITAAELEDIAPEDWRAAYTSELNDAGEMYLYYYSTELSIPSVTYTLKGKEPESFKNQSVVTESYFLSVESRLSPVYSFRSVNRVIPANYPQEAHYAKIDMEYESFYPLSGSNVRTVITTYTTDEETKVRKSSTELFTQSGLNSYQNSVFDVAYLDIVVRAMKNVTGSFSQTVGIYTPGVQIRDYTIANSDKAIFEGDDADAQLDAVQKLLEEKNLFTPKPVDEKDSSKGMTTLKTSSASVSYNGGNYSGVSQTYWFAAGVGSNETRTLMVKYSEPLTYNLGSLDYVLTSIDNIEVVL